MSRNEYASWLLSVISRTFSLKAQILTFLGARYLQLFNFDRLDFMSHALGIESTD